jgi:hypothetical protein
VLLSGMPPQRVEVLDVDLAAPDLDAPALLQLRERPGHGLSIGADHGGELPVGVAGGIHRTILAHDPVQLAEHVDQARQAL